MTNPSADTHHLRAQKLGLYGLLSDWRGVPVTLAIIGVLVFTALPLTFALRAPLEAASPA